MQQINNLSNPQEIFQKFPANNILNNREYISNAIITDNLELKNTKNHKKRRALKIAGATLATVGTVAIAGITIIENLKHGKFIRNVLNKITSEGQKVVKGAQETVDNITGNSKVKEAIRRSVNASDNFTNIKDDLWYRLGEKIPFIKKIGQPFTNLYTNLYKARAQVQYDKAVKAMQEAYGDDILKKIPSFDEMFNGMSCAIEEALHSKGGNRISKGVFNLKGGIKGIFERFTGETIANVPIRETLGGEKYASLMARKTIECTTEEQTKALRAFNDMVDNEMLPKLRDIIGGNGPTDALMIGSSLGALGVSVASAETKEEKKSTAINLGIPLISAIASSIFATWKGISGGKALVFGLATGELGTLAAKTASNIRDKFKKNKEENIKA